MEHKPEPSNADDIAALKERLNLPGLRYVDFATDHELRDAYRRWPLLRDIHAGREEDTP